MIADEAKLNPHIFTTKLNELPTRDGFGDGVVTAGERDENVVVLCADLTESTRSNKFKDKFPKRFFETGVSEQNMAGISAGLAISGKIPFIASYAVFNPGRNWEQIRVSIAYSKANVKIIGAHSGLSVGPDGATHQALEDIALMRVLPNMVVLVPSDYEQAKKATIASANYKGPVYIRLTREKTPVFRTQDSPFEIGKAQILMTGNDVTIICAGPIIYEALKASYELNMKNGIKCEVIDSCTIKPLDEKTILDSVRKTGRVITIEEHQISGGLGGVVSEMLSEKYPVKIKRLGICDSFGESGTYEQLIKKYGLGIDHIIMEVKKLISER